MKLFDSPRAIIAVASALVALSALATDSNIDATKSTLVATFKQEGVPVDAPFRRFSGNITYDVKNISNATAALDVDTASLDIGDEAYNAEVRKKSWFDSATYPKATFRSSTIKAGANGQFDATGTLTIKGKATTITVPVKVQTSAGISIFDGTLTISRKVFGIGDAAWEDVLDDKVSVRFHLVNAATKN